MNLKTNHLYTIEERYFSEINDPYLKDNKNGERPYYILNSEKDNNILWVVPLSSKIKKYENLSALKKYQKQSCVGFHICKTSYRKQVFVIHDMFPVAKEFIKTEFTGRKVSTISICKKDKEIIEKKAQEVRNLAERGIKIIRTQPDILSIEKVIRQGVQ